MFVFSIIISSDLLYGASEATFPSLEFTSRLRQNFWPRSDENQSWPRTEAAPRQKT